MKIPKGIITAEEAQKLNTDWTNFRKQANDSVAARGVDNRSSWFSIQDLEDFIAWVKNNHVDATGLRMYLGVHDVVKGNGGKTTVFMVPTEPNKNPKIGEDPNTDIAGAKGLNKGENGTPPGTDYPN